VRVPGRWRRRSGGDTARPETSLLPKLLAAFVAVLALAGSLTFLLETRLTRQELRQQAMVLSSEQGNALDTRIREDSRRIHLLMSALAQQSMTERAPDRPLSRRLIDVLGTLRVGDSELELASIFDLSSGEELQSLPGRRRIGAPGPLPADGDGLSLRGSQRVVPLVDGGYGLIYTMPVGRLEDPALLLAAGYPLDRTRAGQLASVTGVDEVQIVVDGEVVASSSGPGGGPAPGNPGEQRVTQQLEDGRLVRYVAVGAVHRWGRPASIGLVVDDPLAALDRGLARTRTLMAALLMLVGGSLAFVLTRVMTRPLLELTDTATAIARGDLERSFEVDRGDEIGRLAGALERMRRALRAQLFVIGRQADALQEAARRIVSSQDTERRRVAQDLHDGIQQQLVVLRMQVGAARAQLAQDPTQLDRLTDEIAASVDAILDELRATGQALFPAILRDRGLGGALFSLAGRATLPLHVRLTPDPLPRVDEAVETNAYFLVGEAVTNALKHAGAERIEVDVVHEREALRIRVADDGRGFVQAELAHTGGVVHMQDRVQALGGTLEVRSRPGQGTTVTALFPLAAAGPVAPPSPSDGGPLQVEQDGRDAPVEVELLREPELAEDGVGVLLDGAVGDGQFPRDRGVPPA
jgi:signal transduction histidine kinase